LKGYDELNQNFVLKGLCNLEVSLKSLLESILEGTRYNIAI